jgi:allantoinase
VDQYRYDKVSVTCETCPHYLLMTEEDLRRLGAPAKCAPPLRTVQMRDLLLNRLRDGRIHFVASDHSPAPPSMKTGDDAFAVWGGISGVQSTLASLLTLEPPLEIERVSRLTSSNIADRFRLGKKGQIAGGNDADLALVDVQATFTLTRDMLLDRHKLSPYVGREFRGLVRRTIVRGHTVFQDGRITAESFRGRLIKPSPRAATEGNGLDA